MRMMFHTDLFRKTFRPADLIIAFPEIKSYGKGFLISKIGGDIAGIYAAGKKTADFDIADFMNTDRIFKGFFDPINRFLFGKLVIRFKGSLKIAGSFDLTVTVP